MGSQDVMPAPFERDEEKDRANRAKHGIGFEEATGIFTSQILTAPDTRQDYGEERWISYGSLGPAGGPRRGTYPPPAGRTRLISARKANVKERQAYYESLERSAPDH